MKPVVICDSGLGGLDVASRCFQANIPGNCDIIYFNAWPAIGLGYNQLKTARMQEEVFRSAMEGMAKFDPQCVIIACNTLSIIWEGLRKWYTPSFPVMGIIDVAVDGMLNFLQEDANRILWICGTKTTIESRVYYNRLIDAGISSSRLHEIACPGLATLLEKDPTAPVITQAIGNYAEFARKQISAVPQNYGVAFCCTHFGYAESIWQREFTRVMGHNAVLLNPNGWFKGLEHARSVSYYSRVPFQDNSRENMMKFFEARYPMIALALRDAHIDETLFTPKLGE